MDSMDLAQAVGVCMDLKRVTMASCHVLVIYIYIYYYIFIDVYIYICTNTYVYIAIYLSIYLFLNLCDLYDTCFLFSIP